MKFSECKHPSKDEIMKTLPEKRTIADISKMFKVLGDDTRSKIICILFNSELCVGHLAEILGAEQSAVSHQLKLLRDARLVKTRRDGKIIYYSLADEHIMTVFKMMIEHMEEEGV